jgi:hypothetical protein
MWRNVDTYYPGRWCKMKYLLQSRRCLAHIFGLSIWGNNRVTSMRRCRPRKLRNAYRDRVWIRQVLRSWLRRLGHDLDALDRAFERHMADPR